MGYHSDPGNYFCTWQAWIITVKEIILPAPVHGCVKKRYVSTWIIRQGKSKMFPQARSIQARKIKKVSAGQNHTVKENQRCFRCFRRPESYSQGKSTSSSSLKT
jgi:hypothetical protein